MQYWRMLSSRFAALTPSPKSRPLGQSAITMHLNWRRAFWRAGHSGHRLGEPEVPLRSWRWCGAFRLDGPKFGSSGHPKFEGPPCARRNASKGRSLLSNDLWLELLRAKPVFTQFIISESFKHDLWIKITMIYQFALNPCLRCFNTEIGAMG